MGGKELTPNTCGVHKHLYEYAAHQQVGFVSGSDMNTNSLASSPGFPLLGTTSPQSLLATKKGKGIHGSMTQ